jgi:glycosylphosphatidylinositol deacylase
MQRQSSEKAAEDDADTPAVAINTAGDAAITNGSKPLLFGPTPTASLSTARFDGTTPRDHSLRRSRGGSIEEPPSKARSRRPSPTTATWNGGDAHNGNGFIGKEGGLSKASVIGITPVGQAETDKMSSSNPQTRLPTYRSPWSATPLMLFITTLAITFILVIAHSFTWRQLDCKGCRMSYMRPSFARLHDFDTEHTRFASKYSVYLYREQLVDEDTKVRSHTAQVHSLTSSH